MEAQGVVEEDYARRLKTSEGATKRWQVISENLNTTIGAALLPTINRLGEALMPIAGYIADMAERFPGLKNAVVSATAGLLGFRFAAIGLQFLGLNFKGALLQTAFAFTRLGDAIRRAGSAGKTAVALQKALGKMSGQRMTTLQKVGTALRGIVGTVPRLSVLGGVLGTIGGALAAISAPIWAGIAAGAVALGAAGFAIYRYWDRLSSIFSGVAKRIGEELAPTMERLSPVIAVLGPIINPLGSIIRGVGEAFSWVSTKIQEVTTLLGSFFSRETLTDQQKASWEQAGYDVADGLINAVKAKMNEMLDWFKGLPGRILSAIGSINIGSLISWPTMPSWLSGASGGAATPAKRATGGPVTRGRPYWVGEKGPEPFIPNPSGRIVPAGGAGTTIHYAPRVNIDGSGLNVYEMRLAVEKARRDQFELGMRSVFADIQRP